VREVRLAFQWSHPSLFNVPGSLKKHSSYELWVHSPVAVVRTAYAVASERTMGMN
jgi:hypothetical protein